MKIENEKPNYELRKFEYREMTLNQSKIYLQVIKLCYYSLYKYFW